MASSNSNTSGYSRRSVLGIDTVTIETEAALKRAQGSGELERIGAVDVSDLQWLLRAYLPRRQIYSREHGVWSLPMRPASSHSYAPCVKFVRDAHDWDSREGRDFGADAVRIADILLSGRSEADEASELQQACAEIMWRFYDEAHGGSGALPEGVVQAAAKQLTSPGDMFLRPKKKVQAKGIAQVFTFTDEFRQSHAETAALPKEVTADLAHTIFIMTLNAAALCRALRQERDKEIGELFRDLGLSDTALRIVNESGTLGGLLDESEKTSKLRTVVTINLADIARESGNADYAFQVDGDRPCPAKYQLLALGRAVQRELQNREGKGI